MKIIPASFELLYPITPDDVIRELRFIESAGRTCYKSEHRISDTSYLKFIDNIIEHGHLSVIEHGIARAKIITDRGVTHELVRHRLASYSQESTRYCDYNASKFNKELTFIKPPGLSNDALYLWDEAMLFAEECYLDMRMFGMKPQIARSVLPNSLKAEIFISANFREWMHIFKLRTSPAAHPQIRQVMISGQEQLAKLIPVIFDRKER